MNFEVFLVDVLLWCDCIDCSLYRSTRLAIASVLLLAAAATYPSVHSTPNVPHVGGLIEQTNITGHFEGVATYSDNDFIAVGSYDGIEQNVPTEIVLTPTNGLIVRYHSTGSFHWARQLDAGENDIFVDVEVMSDNSAVVLGQVCSACVPEIQEDCRLHIGALFPPDIISAKYLDDGTLDWWTVYDQTTTTFARGNALDSEPKLLVAGGKVAFGVLNGFAHPFVVRYESLG